MGVSQETGVVAGADEDIGADSLQIEYAGVDHVEHWIQKEYHKGKQKRGAEQIGNGFLCK